MSRLFASASSQYMLATAAAIAAPTTVTVAAWFRPTTIVNGTIGGIGDTNSSEYLSLGSTGAGAAFFENTGVFASSTATASAGAWAHYAGVQSSTSNRIAYLNGAAGSAETTARTIASADRTIIGGEFINNTPGFYQNGAAADFAIWNVALTAAEVASLVAGVSPLLIRPQSLVFYAPLIGDASPEQDIRGGLALTLTNAPTKSANHPRLFKPRGSLIVGKPTGASPQTILPGFISAGSQTFSPTFVPGPVTISPGFIASGEQVFAPALNQIITPGFIASGAQLFAPTLTPGPVTVTPGFIASAEQVFAPTVTGQNTVLPGFIASGEAVYAPTLVPGSVTVLPGFIASGAQVFQAALSGGDVVAAKGQRPTMGVG